MECSLECSICVYYDLTDLTIFIDVYDATPAVFCAHALIRRFYGLIALQQAMMNKAKAMVDILFGGGRQYFIPSSKPGGKRNDEFDITTNYSQNGWNSYIETNSSLHNLSTSDLPSIGLFTLAAFPYYLDRKTNNDGTTPNIMDMVTKAIELLSEKYADEGFLLMVESARIDHCGFVIYLWLVFNIVILCLTLNRYQ